MPSRKLLAMWDNLRLNRKRLTGDKERFSQHFQLTIANVLDLQIRRLDFMADNSRWQ